MKYLIKKNIRDFWQLKSEFISILLLSFLGIFLFTGLTYAWVGMNENFNSWANESNLADAWVGVSNIDEQQVDNLLDIEGINEIQTEEIYNASLNDQKQLRIVVPDKNTISMPLMIEGDEFSLTNEGIWIDQYFAEDNNYKIGDSIKIENNGITINLKVKGIILSPDYISYTGPNNEMVPDHEMYGYAYTNTESLTTNEWVGSKEILIKADDNGKNIEQYQNDIEHSLGTSFASFTSRENYTYVSGFTQKIFTLEKLSFIFSVVIFLLVLLTVSTTMHRIVKNQQTLIGTLKAIGIRNRAILLHYSLYGLGVCAIGGIIGYILGPYTITPFILNLQKDLYMMNKWSGEKSPYPIIILIILIVIGTISSLLSAKKTINVLPSEIMRPQLTENAKRSFLEIFSGIWNKLSFEWKWVFRDVSRNKKKTILAIVGIIGSMILLIISTNMPYTFQKNNNDLYGEQYSYAFKSTFKSDASLEDKQEVLSDIGQAQFIQEGSVTLRTASESELSILEIVGDGVYVKLPDLTGKTILLDDEGVVISKHLAEKMNIGINDTIQVKLLGSNKYISMPITNIANVMSPQGIFISEKTWETLTDIPYNPTAILIGNAFSKDDIDNYESIDNTVSLSEQLEEANIVLDTVSGIIILIGVIAVIISCTVLYNLGTLNFTERYREYATMKVLGFRQNEIRAIIIRDNLFNFIIGWIIGLPIGVAFLNVFVSMINTDSTAYIPHVTIARIMLATAIILVCSISVSIIICKKIKGIDMIESLKSVE